MDMEMFVEMIARMTKSDKDEFVQTFVEKWPHLAEEIAFSTFKVDLLNPFFNFLIIY